MGLGTFWLRRARRLLPALFLTLIVVSVWVAVFDAGQLVQVRRQVIAAALYVGNWSTIAQHGSYFARFAAPLPLDHLWSLAIEEQFYLIWPWVLLLGVRAVRNRRHSPSWRCSEPRRRRSSWVSFTTPGTTRTRAYEGTDTRASRCSSVPHSMVRPSRTAGGAAPSIANILDGLGIAGLVAIAVLNLEDERVLDIPLPLGVRAALGRDRARCRGGREPRQPLGRDPRLEPRCGGSASAPTASI